MSRFIKSFYCVSAYRVVYLMASQSHYWCNFPTIGQNKHFLGPFRSISHFLCDVVLTNEVNVLLGSPAPTIGPLLRPSSLVLSLTLSVSASRCWRCSKNMKTKSIK